MDEACQGFRNTCSINDARCEHARMAKNALEREWDEEEKAKLPERFEIASEIIKSFGTAGLENTMTAFNGK